MKLTDYVANFSLICVIYMGCSDETLLIGLPNLTHTNSRSFISTIVLNPVEVRLKGGWYLRSMSTADTLFCDSLYNRSSSIRFTDLGFPGNNKALFMDKANLAVKAKPNDLFLVNDDSFYNVLDSGRLRIIFNYFLVPTPDTSFFKITFLSNNSLVLTDSIQKKQWTFYRQEL